MNSILGQQDYKTNTESFLKLNTKISSIDSHRNNRKLGPLHLITQSEVHNVLSIVCVAPLDNSGQLLIIPDEIRCPQIANIKEEN